MCEAESTERGKHSSRTKTAITRKNTDEFKGGALRSKRDTSSSLRLTYADDHRERAHGVSSGREVNGKDYRSSQNEDRVMDETQFSNPHSFDYNFEDDLRKPADTNDIYDEVVPFLPGFVLHKNGKDVGYTRVPIVTRKVPTWSTPRPRNRKLDIYDPWTMPPYGASTWRSQTKPPLSKLQLIHPKGLQEKLDRSY
ncbi:unnamed protein product [Toxocara canis]|uniref:Uncharacterized protein n=1 Tax=Toxocara canis TaxID=6265 RepID=A0A183TYW7_TOXCA|nr:unnamed protein product [Toxocara canis]